MAWPLCALFTKLQSLYRKPRVTGCSDDAKVYLANSFIKEKKESILLVSFFLYTIHPYIWPPPVPKPSQK